MGPLSRTNEANFGAPKKEPNIQIGKERATVVIKYELFHHIHTYFVGVHQIRENLSPIVFVTYLCETT